MSQKHLQKWRQHFLKKLKSLYTVFRTIQFCSHFGIAQNAWSKNQFFAANLPLKLFRSTIANAHTGNLKSLKTLFYLIYVSLNFFLFSLFSPFFPFFFPSLALILFYFSPFFFLHFSTPLVAPGDRGPQSSPKIYPATFDIVNKWWFLFCIFDPILVEIHQSMWNLKARTKC